MSFTNNKTLYLMIQKLFYIDNKNLFQIADELQTPYEQVRCILYDITRTTNIEMFVRDTHQPLVKLPCADLPKWLEDNGVSGNLVDNCCRFLFSTDTDKIVGKELGIKPNIAYYNYFKFEPDFRTILMRANIILTDLPRGRAVQGDALSPYYIINLKQESKRR